MTATVVYRQEVLSGRNVVHSCFQWISTLYVVFIKNPIGVDATLLAAISLKWL